MGLIKAMIRLFACNKIRGPISFGYFSPGEGGGGTLIFSYIRRLGSFLGVQNFEFQYFLGFQKNKYFWV